MNLPFDLKFNLKSKGGRITISGSFLVTLLALYSLRQYFWQKPVELLENSFTQHEIAVMSFEFILLIAFLAAIIVTLYVRESATRKHLNELLDKKYDSVNCYGMSWDKYDYIPICKNCDKKLEYRVINHVDQWDNQTREEYFMCITPGCTNIKFNPIYQLEKISYRQAYDGLQKRFGTPKCEIP